MIIYNTISDNNKSSKKISSIATNTNKKSSKSKKRKSGGRVRSLRRNNVNFLKSLGFKVRKNRKTK